MRIRIAKTSDLEQYTNLLQQAYQSTYTNEAIGLTTDCFSKKIFASIHTQKYLKLHLDNTKTQKTWLAFESKKLIGAATCILINNHEAELADFYVHPRYQQQGIGKKLYTLVIEFAKGKELVLDIYTHNRKTIKMYKKWGWQLDTSRGENGYFYRHWPEWPKNLQARCMYMKSYIRP